MEGKARTPANIEKYFNKAFKISQQTSKHVQNFNQAMNDLT